MLGDRARSGVRSALFLAEGADLSENYFLRFSF